MDHPEVKIVLSLVVLIHSEFTNQNMYKKKLYRSICLFNGIHSEKKRGGNKERGICLYVNKKKGVLD